MLTCEVNSFQFLLVTSLLAWGSVENVTFALLLNDSWVMLAFISVCKSSLYFREREKKNGMIIESSNNYNRARLKETSRPLYSYQQQGKNSMLVKNGQQEKKSASRWGRRDGKVVKPCAWHPRRALYCVLFPFLYVMSLLHTLTHAHAYKRDEKDTRRAGCCCWPLVYTAKPPRAIARMPRLWHITEQLAHARTRLFWLDQFDNSIRLCALLITTRDFASPLPPVLVVMLLAK